MLVGNQSPAEHALHRIVYPGAGLEGTEGPKAYVFPRVRDAHKERKRARRTDRRAEFGVQNDHALVHRMRTGITG